MRKTETVQALTRRHPYRSPTGLQASDTRIIVETLATARRGQPEMELEISVLQGCLPPPLSKKVTLTRAQPQVHPSALSWQVPGKGTAVGEAV